MAHTGVSGAFVPLATDTEYHEVTSISPLVFLKLNDIYPIKLKAFALSTCLLSEVLPFPIHMVNV